MKISNSKRKLNNKGFSLIELIVTIAIMGILVGAAVVTVSMLDSSYVEDAERGIKDSLSLARTKSMSVAAKDWYVAIKKESSEYYTYLYKVIEEVVEEGGVDTTVEKDILIEKRNIGKKITIKYGVDKDSMRTVEGTNELELHYDSATGKIKEVTYAGSPVTISSGLGYLGISRNDYNTVLKVFYNTGKCERE
jgi:prepilin-type N-terminal cleavage/methylation domain-containing protein